MLIPPGGSALAEKVSTTEEINAAIKKQIKRSKTVKISGLNGQNYIAIGLTTDKQLVFEGTAGDFFGALNNGALITLNGAARRFLGNNISRGGIIVQGNVQRGVGVGMSGGIIVIRGSVTGDIGQLAKGGSIIVSGNCGSHSGAYMFDGELIVAGDLGEDIGLYMTGGTIYYSGKIGSLGTNTQVRDLTVTDEKKLKKYFEHYGITKAPRDFKKIVPVDKRPWKNKLFEFDSNSNLSSSNKPWSESEVFEIISKTKTELLSLSGANYSTHDPDNKSNSYFDRLSIIPIQTKSIKNMKLIENELDTRMTIGYKLESPLKLELPFYLSTRGSGVVSKPCKMAYIFTAAKLNIPLDTGGRLFPEEYELNTKHDGKLIHQWNTGRLGVDIEYISRSNAIEIVLGTGGSGSLPTVIPSEKITPELSEMWHISEGVDVILPPKILDFDVPADLKRHVELIRELTNFKIPILIKLAAGNVYEDTKLAVRAGADAIVIEGFDGSNQNLPSITANNLGLPVIAAIPQAVKALSDTRSDKRGVKLICAGKFKNGADVFKALALGANAVIINTAGEIAIGCELCGTCNANTCPKGIATTHPEREIKLDWVDAGLKLTNFLKTIAIELKFLMILAGYKTLNDFNINSLRALDYDTAAVTGAALVGYEKMLPMWEH